jgi:hypothetical protein
MTADPTGNRPGRCVRVGSEGFKSHAEPMGRVLQQVHCGPICPEYSALPRFAAKPKQHRRLADGFHLTLG